MKKILFGLISIVVFAFAYGSMPAKAGYYDDYYSDNYSYPYDYSYYNDYGYDPYYSDYNWDYSYPYDYSYDNYDSDYYGYPYDYSSGWYDDDFYNNYNNYYNNGWDYNYVPYDYDYNWDNYQTNNNYNYGWDNNYGPMYVWNNNQSNPTFQLNNYQDFFNTNNLFNYYPNIRQSKPTELTIRKIEFISKEETTKNIVIDNSRNGNCQISQARIVVSRTTFIKIQETIQQTGDISMDIRPDHSINFKSSHGNFQENNAAIYFSKN